MRQRLVVDVLVALLLIGSVPRTAPPRLIGVDRVKHFFMSFFIQSVSYSALRAVNVGSGPALAGATVATGAVSVSKEIWDRRHGKAFDRGDLVWDALGAGAASALLVRTVGDK